MIMLRQNGYAEFDKNYMRLYDTSYIDMVVILNTLSSKKI